MTQVAERPQALPLTNPVPGAWLQLADRSIPPVYVPFEPITRKNEQTNKDEVTGYGPGAHCKRLLSEGAMYTAAPGQPGNTPIEQLVSTEQALRAQLEQAEAAREAMEQQLMELRAKMAADPGVPNAPKRR